MEAKAIKEGILITDGNENGLIEWKKLLTTQQTRKLMHDLQDALFDLYHLEER
jgi:hypothetical protein